MLRPRRRTALPALVLAAVLTLALAACSGEPEEAAEPAPAPVASTESEPPAEPPPPPPPPETRIRVVDGDSSKPVRGARVEVRGERARTGPHGVAALAVERRRTVKVRVSARGYIDRALRVELPKRGARKIELWRRATQWPMYGVDPARTQVHPGIKLRPPFRRVWERNFYGLLEYPAVVWEGVAYANTIQGWLRAVSMKNGRLLWKTRVGTRIASAPGIDPERRLLVVTTMEPGNVSVVDMDTGKVRWRFYSGRAEPSPLVMGGVAYFGAANGNVYALDLDRRRLRWTFNGGVKITASPTRVGNRLFFGDYAGRVFALNVRTGRLVWRGSAGTRVYGTAAAAGGRLFVPSVFSGLSALSTRTGRLLWRIPVGAYMYSSPAVYRGRVYFGTYGSRIYCADARTGRILWSRPADGRVSGAVQVVAGVVYAATIDDTMTAWHWRTGKRLWSFPHGEYVPVSGNGARLLLHGHSIMWAVEPKRTRRQ